MIQSIKFGQEDAWLKKKKLEQKAQESVSANQIQNIQPQEQTNGTNQVQQANQASAAIPAQAANIPWQGFMGTLGLSPQGSSSADMSAIGEKLSQMKAQATDPTQKSQIENLQKQYEGYKAVAANMPAQTAPQQNQSTSVEQMTGATQLSELNKLLLLKKKSI